jgi:hypothetical protein
LEQSAHWAIRRMPSAPEAQNSALASVGCGIGLPVSTAVPAP